jgi:hypothetical protein
MALRDTTWMWDTTTGTVKVANAILLSKSGGVEVVSQGTGTQTRKNTTTTYEFIAVTKAAALSVDSKVNADTANTTEQISLREVNRIVGEYGVTYTVNNKTGWS